MTQVLALFSGLFRRSDPDKDIIAALQSGDEKRVRRAEDLLFGNYRYMIDRMPFKGILKDRLDREEAYSKAFFSFLKNIKTGKFRGDSSLKTYFHKIFLQTCMTRVRENATKTNNPVELELNPSDKRLKNIPADVQDKLRALMSQESSTLWDWALEQFRHSNYPCYYLLTLLNASFSYQEILGFGDKGKYELDDGTEFMPHELGNLEDKPLQWDVTPATLKNIASNCRAELRALVERLKNTPPDHKP